MGKDDNDCVIDVVEFLYICDIHIDKDRSIWVRLKNESMKILIFDFSQNVYFIEWT